MLVRVKKYRQLTPRRDFGPTFTKKVGLKRKLLGKNLFNQIKPGSPASTARRAAPRLLSQTKHCGQAAGMTEFGHFVAIAKNKKTSRYPLGRFLFFVFSIGQARHFRL